MKPQIVFTADGREFRNQPAFVRKVYAPKGNGIITDIKTNGDPESFQDLKGKRNLRSKGILSMQRNLVTNEGLSVANVGVSGVYTLEIAGENYAVACTQYRGDDLKDSVVKLISGYVDARHFDDPFTAMREELTGEFIPMTSYGTILRGFDGENLGKSYHSTMAYDPRTPGFCIANGEARFTPDGLDTDPIHINGKPVHENPRLYFQQPTNSAQLVYSAHIEFPEGLGGITLLHAEEKSEVEVPEELRPTEFRDSPRPYILHTLLGHDQIVLMRINRSTGKLSGDMFTFEEGRLKSYEAPVVLSEVFAQKWNGIVSAKNITLDTYIER
jgi:hypothetical protein